MRLTAKQTAALDLLEDSTTKAILYGGAAGGGKTHLMAYFALKTCLKFPGSVGGIGRKELKRLKQTILVSFFRIAKEQGVLNQFKYDRQMSEIVFKNGSIIYLMDLSERPTDPDFERLGSTEFTFILIEEAGEICEKAFNILKTRIRYNLVYGVPKLGLSANPTKNFLKRVFFDRWQKGELPDHMKFVQAFATDNAENLDPSYLETLDELEGVDRERLRNGNWNYADDDLDLITWENIQDIFSSTPKITGKKYLTADIATYGADNFLIMLWDGLNIERIWVIPKSDGRQIVEKLKEIKTLYQVPSSRIIFDGDGVGSMLGGFLSNAVRFQNGAKTIRDVSDAFYTKNLKREYENLKTQCAYKAAQIIRNAGMTCTDHRYKGKMEQELQQLQRSKVDSDTNLFIKSKEEIKKSLGRSPDFLDNIIMRAFFEIRRN